MTGRGAPNAAPDDPRLEDLMRAVLRSRRYRAISPHLVHRVGAHELAAHGSVAGAIKATKAKLYQVTAAYLPAAIDYDASLARLRQAARDGEALRDVCRDVMARHVSTRERLPILERIYAETLAGLAPRVVVDVACGLNPLAIPWMPLAAEACYYAYDAYTDMAAFLAECLPLFGVAGEARARDVAQAPPVERADLALVLKTVPCLEQQSRGAGLRLLDALDAEHVLVSFPVRSIGGRSKGMAEHYEAGFVEMAKQRPWQVTRFDFASELTFLVRKGRNGDASQA